MSPKLSQLLYTQLSPSGATFKHTKNGFWIGNTGVCRECNWVTEAASIRPIVRSVITTANNSMSYAKLFLLQANFTTSSQETTRPWYLQVQAKKQTML